MNRTFAVALIAGTVLFSMVGCSAPQQRLSEIEILECVKSHDYVFRGKVVNIGTPPGFWSGCFAATQKIEFEVLDVYKGNIGPVGNHVFVNFIIVGGGRFEDKIPQVNPNLVAPGKEFILFATKSFPGLEDSIYAGCGDTSIIAVPALEGKTANQSSSQPVSASKPATSQAEPFMFLGVAENQSGQEGPTGTINGQASRVAKISAVAEVSWQEYLSAKQAGKIFASQEHDGYVYYAVKSLRDVRFDNASATVEITERFKAKKP